KLVTGVQTCALPISGAEASRALERSLAALAEEALIYEERVVPEEEYSFQHVLTQETIYQSIPERQRQHLHQQVAEALEWLHRDEIGRASCRERVSRW